jgi:RNA polymerase sigma-70 factor (ECF subfamily)
MQTQIDHSNPRLIESIVRRSYGRLLAMLSVRSGDLSSAEDALATAFETALKNWPEQGVPTNPEAWLFTVARRQLIDQARSAQTQQRHQEEFSYLVDEAAAECDPLAIPDQRLALMFACTHPAIDRSIRAPLMLQMLLGFDAASIASAFVIAPSNMAQRLVRAKNKIRVAGIRLTIPDQSAINDGLDAVLDAIYSIYTTAWSQTSDGDIQQANLAEEALWLTQLLSQVAPQEPEVFGLLALMLYAESRRAARHDERGNYVPLQEQDHKQWDHDKIDQAEQYLRHASRMLKYGRFQIEAAIQSAHTVRRHQGKADWQAINKLYAQLYQLTTSPVVGINQAVAMAEIATPQMALARLEQLSKEVGLKDRMSNYQPYWAAMAHLQQLCGNVDAAKHAYIQAIGMCTDQATRLFLQSRLQQLSASPIEQDHPQWLNNS